MGSLKVVCLATYLTRVDQGWRNSDYTASKFIKALKGMSFRGYADFPVRGDSVRLQEGDREAAISCFSQVAADHLVAEEDFRRAGPVCLVPIPSSDAVKGTRFTRFPARDLAHALAAELAEQGVQVEVSDILRWKQPKTASHTGGPRNAHVLYDNLVLTEEPDGLSTYVLVDDVITGGGHLKAAKLRLVKAGASVALGVCAGRSVQEPPDDPLAILVEELPDLISLR